MDGLQKEYKSVEKVSLDGVAKVLPKTFKKISCPSCGTDTPADNLNLQHQLGKCGNCGAVFSIKAEIQEIESAQETKTQIFKPEGIDVFYFQDNMDITVDQHIEGADAWLISMVPSFTFLVWMITLASDKVSIPLWIPIIMSVFSLYYIYKAITYKRNKTYLEINKHQFTIQHRPKNYKKDHQYTSSQIDQIYLKHSTTRPGFFTLFMILNGPDGQKHEQLISVSTLSKAKYLEQEIEHYLGIEDRKVPEATV